MSNFTSTFHHQLCYRYTHAVKIFVNWLFGRVCFSYIIGTFLYFLTPPSFRTFLRINWQRSNEYLEWNDTSKFLTIWRKYIDCNQIEFNVLISAPCCLDLFNFQVWKKYLWKKKSCWAYLGHLLLPLSQNV